MDIAIVINPRSRQNRRDPSLMGYLSDMLGSRGKAVAPDDHQMADFVDEIVKSPPRILAVHGGDGTLHFWLTRLAPAFAAAGCPLPPLALLSGGTMNVVARSLGLHMDAGKFMQALMGALERGDDLSCVQRRCLRIGERHGFVFGNGVFASFLEAYYADASYGSMQALRVGAKSLWSGLRGSAYVKAAMRPFEGSAVVDGETLAAQRYTAITAATVSQVGMGFKLHHRADEDMDRFSVVAIHGSPLSVLADLASVRLGLGMSASRADTRTANELTLTPKNEMLYTIDGDLYREKGPLTIASGPLLRLVVPPGREERAKGDLHPLPGGITMGTTS